MSQVLIQENLAEADAGLLAAPTSAGAVLPDLA
jgi:hypothetical protein